MRSAEYRLSCLPKQLRVAAALVGARPRLLAAYALAGLLTAGPAVAEPLYNKPVYNPKTKSYFELVPIPAGFSIRGSNREINWRRAKRYAEEQVYKGAHGRLAVVKSVATHEFLIDTFRPDTKTWIGLRYFCKERTLVWADGSHATKKSFAIWGVPWNMGYACKDKGAYAGVFYNPINGGFFWQAQGVEKEYPDLFIEFPTGAPRTAAKGERRKDQAETLGKPKGTSH